MFEILVPSDVKVTVTIDYFRLRSNSISTKSMKFTKKSFFYTILGFTQSQSGPSYIIPEVFAPNIPETYKKTLLRLLDLILFI